MSSLILAPSSGQSMYFFKLFALFFYYYFFVLFLFLSVIFQAVSCKALIFPQELEGCRSKLWRYFPPLKKNMKLNYSCVYLLAVINSNPTSLSLSALLRELNQLNVFGSLPAPVCASSVHTVSYLDVWFCPVFAFSPISSLMKWSLKPWLHSVFLSHSTRLRQSRLTAAASCPDSCFTTARQSVTIFRWRAKLRLKNREVTPQLRLADI